jgi:peptidoglycan/xylan/chitin deacetylase (PgdA/CDA1 family)
MFTRAVGPPTSTGDAAIQMPLTTGSDWRQSCDRVVNLCFHGIGAPDRALEPDEELYWVSFDRFEALLETIATLPAARITFDDGNASDFEWALPALQRRKLTATFFVIAGRLDRQGSLTRGQVRALARAGMKIGSHGMFHRPWRSLSRHELRTDLVDARQLISDAAGEPVRQVACPFGSYDRTVLSVIGRCGFTRVYTVDGGSARAAAWLQSRHTIRHDDTPDRIGRLVQSPDGSLTATAVRAAKSFVKRCR